MPRERPKKWQQQQQQKTKRQKKKKKKEKENIEWYSLNMQHMPSKSLRFLWSFDFFGHAHSTLDPHHSSDPSRCSDNAGSLTCWARGALIFFGCTEAFRVPQVRDQIWARAVTYTTTVAMPDPSTHCVGPGMETASWCCRNAADLLHHSGNSRLLCVCVHGHFRDEDIEAEMVK